MFLKPCSSAAAAAINKTHTSTHGSALWLWQQDDSGTVIGQVAAMSAAARRCKLCRADLLLPDIAMCPCSMPCWQVACLLCSMLL
jgi:hypothetical protein